MVETLSNERDVILRAVRDMYTEVASNPGKAFHFPTGRDACLFVGYPVDQVDSIPATATESFAGVAYPHAGDAIKKGDTVLDVGSGSGTDSLIASLMVGDEGRVHGLDMTQSMLDKLQVNIDVMGATNVAPLEGNAEEIPLSDKSVDSVTSNGVLNLVPGKARAFGEIFRVLKPGGRVQIADIVVGTPIGDACKSDPELWAECVVGAELESTYLTLFEEAGFQDVKVLRHFDYFAGSASEATRKVAGGFNACSIELSMMKP